MMDEECFLSLQESFVASTYFGQVYDSHDDIQIPALWWPQDGTGNKIMNLPNQKGRGLIARRLEFI